MIPRGSGNGGGMREIRQDGLHAIEAGTGPVLVLLHGASGNARDWAISVLPQLATAWRVIAFDRPGFGHSTAGARPWLLADQSDRMRAALRAMGVGRYALMGHSYGATLALDWAARAGDEVTGVVALSGPLASWRGRLAPRYALGRALWLARAVGQVVPWLVGPATLAGELAEVFAPQPVPPDYVAAAEVRLALRPATFAVNLRAMATLHAQTQAIRPHLTALRCPVEVVHGDADRVIPWVAEPGPLGMAVPGARLTLLPGIGHMPQHAAPAEVVAAATRLKARLSDA